MLTEHKLVFECLLSSLHWLAFLKVPLTEGHSIKVTTYCNQSDRNNFSLAQSDHNKRL